jgi:hypothetical protein
LVFAEIRVAQCSACNVMFSNRLKKRTEFKASSGLRLSTFSESHNVTPLFPNPVFSFCENFCVLVSTRKALLR